MSDRVWKMTMTKNRYPSPDQACFCPFYPFDLIDASKWCEEVEMHDAAPLAALTQICGETRRRWVKWQNCIGQTQQFKISRNSEQNELEIYNGWTNNPLRTRTKLTFLLFYLRSTSRCSWIFVAKYCFVNFIFECMLEWLYKCENSCKCMDKCLFHFGPPYIKSSTALNSFRPSD